MTSERFEIIYGCDNSTYMICKDCSNTGGCTTPYHRNIVVCGGIDPCKVCDKL
jgi:hypothetical protein